MISPSFALSLWLAVWGLAPSYPPSPTPSVAAQEKQQHNSATSQPDIKSGQVTKENDCVENQSAQDDQESSPDWITRFTGMLAIVALLQLIAMVAQAIYMRRALRDGKKVAEAAKESAEAATQSVESLKILNRARINIEAIFFENVDDDKSETFRVKCKIRNSGATTGHIFRQLDSFFWRATNRELPEQPPYPTGGDPKDFDIAPNQLIQWFTEPPIQKSRVENWEQVDKGTLRLISFGYIKYSDEFGDEHETRYAVRFLPGDPSPELITKPGYNNTT